MSSGTWAKLRRILGVLALGLAACEGPAAQVTTLSVPLAILEGNAFWLPTGQQESIPLNGSVSLSLDDQVWTPPDQDATLQLADGSSIHLAPDSKLSLRRPYGADSRPVFRLLTGRFDVTAVSSSFVVESYREIPVALRIALAYMVLEPKGTPSAFVLAFDGDTVKAQVESGAVDVRTLDAAGTLQAEWRAVLEPDALLRIISPVTLTPTPSRTPIASPTSPATATGTATATPTATATRSFIPSTPTATAIIPTNTATAASGGSKPKPTATNPPPTNTPIPPSNTPEPTPTPTPPRPTATPQTPAPTAGGTTP